MLFAVAGGAAVGNLYWAQPLLDFIARDLRASPASARWLVTATQIGYAIGIILIVPLGGAIGSAAAAALWSAGGWTAVTVTGSILSIFALAIWGFGRRGALVVTTAG
jgi:hypothetical protein